MHNAIVILHILWKITNRHFLMCLRIFNFQTQGGVL